MNDITTATIETLTAEVRVLMVGNRQITMSVAKQLDLYDWFNRTLDQFYPFGRINTGEKFYRDPATGSVLHGIQSGPISPRWHFIGKDTETGALTRLLIAEDLSQSCSNCRIDLLDEWDHLPLIILAGLR